MLRFDRKQQNSVKQLSFNKKKIKKERKEKKICRGGCLQNPADNLLGLVPNINTLLSLHQCVSRLGNLRFRETQLTFSAMFSMN